MLDFLKVSVRTNNKGTEIYPNFKVRSSSDLMIRGSDFYAIWNEEENMWCTNEEAAIDLIDKELDIFAKEHGNALGNYKISYMWDSNSGSIDRWHKYCQKQMRDSFHPLDESLIFANTEPSKTNYASKKLPYALEEGNCSAYNELMSVLYSPEERRKIEWAIGAIVTGASKHIQKFLVFYGSAGTGKSTVLNIIQDLFQGYYSVFDAKALGSNNNVFALEAFKSNPLVAIQHDGDLSKIEDNTRLNSIVSHELMTVNEKFKSTYANKFNCFLFMGTNRPVKITDAKSGILRRLIDVSPTGEKLGIRKYNELTRQIKFELGAIAWHCKMIFEEDPNYYDDYVPISMMGASNDFFNFMFDNYDIFEQSQYVTLKQAWEMYNTWNEETKSPYPFSRRIFKEELKNYFKQFNERIMIDGVALQNVYSIFNTSKFEYKTGKPKEEIDIGWLNFKKQKSIFDEACKECVAQYANDAGTPTNKWDKVKSVLKELDTSKLHYVKVPENHIVIDFDIQNELGFKDLKKNIEAASKFPKTYAELSKSGKGIHLHYIYKGDVNELSRIFAPHIEVKVFTGNSSLRRMLTQCNNEPINDISSGLPLKKKENKMVDFDSIKSEKGLRSLIKKNLNKEIHPGTKPSIDFIFKILEDAYNSGLKYDVSDLQPSIISFAAGSTHHSEYCLEQACKMKFKSEDSSNNVEKWKSDELIFYDVEVFPNLFLVNYKVQGKGKPVTRLINPKPSQIEELIKYKLVGFNCRRYDNHIMYARLMGYSEKALFELSQRIINGEPGGLFSEAYNLSYTDVYDFCSEKQSLKKWEIELGIHHQELGLPWDQPVPEELWPKVAEYCDNDVIATEAVFEARKADFVAREILADIAGGTVNDTTNSLTTKFIFGSERHPELVYTDLSIDFPGYSFDRGVSTYRGEVTGEGGYVYSEPGMYMNVALLDIASMHPSSTIALNMFGDKYTAKFKEILDARLAIKHKEFAKARKMFDGKLEKYLDDESMASALAQALKIVINSVYGLTSAKFANPFKDPRNIDNIVAKRGALFMIDLKHEVQKRGYTVAHIKTDSIKIPNADNDIIEFVKEYGKKYGYNFEHEATYDKMCLVNDAVYIAKYADGEHEFKLSTGEKISTKWTATGTQFQVPYVFKRLFAKKDIKFADMCETKSVAKGTLYLDYNENLGPDEHNYIFVGKVGQFCPIKPGCGGAELFRENDGKYYAAAGTKGYRWIESEIVKNLKREKDIDESYYINMCDEAVKAIAKYGDFEWFISDDILDEVPFEGGVLVAG